MWREPKRASRRWIGDVMRPPLAYPDRCWSSGGRRYSIGYSPRRPIWGATEMQMACWTPATPYREIRTLDRTFLNCARIQSRPDDHVGRVSAAFEFFDLLPSILPMQIRATQVYETLMHPSRAERILSQSFTHAPGEIGAHLTERVAQVVAHIREETLETVVPGRRRTPGVLVGDKRSPPVPPDEYVAKLFPTNSETRTTAMNSTGYGSVTCLIRTQGTSPTGSSGSAVHGCPRR